MVAYADLPGNPTSHPLHASTSNDMGGRMDVDEERAGAVIDEINAGRRGWAYEDMEIDSEAQVLPSHPATLKGGQSLLAVIDTNVLLNHVDLLQPLIDFLASTKYSTPPCSLVIPRIVVQELDKLKSSSRTTNQAQPLANPNSSAASRHASSRPSDWNGQTQTALNALAGRVASWMVVALKERPACVRGQSREETSLPHQVWVDSADDLILDVALYLKTKSPSSNVVLVSGDKLLQAKALSDHIRIASPKPGCDLAALLHSLHPDLMTIYLNQHPLQFDNQYKPVEDGRGPDEWVDDDGGMELDFEVVIREVVEQEREMPPPSVEPSEPPLPSRGPPVAFVGMRGALAVLLGAALARLWPELVLPEFSASAALRHIESQWTELSIPPHTSSNSTSRRAIEARAALWRERLSSVKALASCLERTEPLSTSRWSRGRLEGVLVDAREVLDLLVERKVLDAASVDSFVTSCTALLHDNV